MDISLLSTGELVPKNLDGKNILTAVTSGLLQETIRYGPCHGLDNLRYLPLSL